MPTLPGITGLLAAGAVLLVRDTPYSEMPLGSSLWTAVWCLLWMIPVYCHLVYPVLCAAWGASAEPTAELPEAERPPLLVVCVYHNELEILPEKLKNTLELDYPGCEALFVSDASDDGSDDLVRAEPQVALICGDTRRGKPAVLDAVLRRERARRPAGTVVLLTDANTILDRNAARRLAAALADPAVKFACGRLVLEPGINPLGDWERRYWAGENRIKRGEGARGWLIGANGGLWTFRLGDYPGLGTDRLVMEDLLIPLRLLAAGGKGVYVGDAVGTERVAPSDMREFRRKLRIADADFSMLPLLLKLSLTPGPRFCLWSHKLLRWLFPLLVPILLLMPLVKFWLVGALPDTYLSTFDFFASLGLYFLLAITLVLAGVSRWEPRLAGLRYALAMNSAFLIAGIGWLLGIKPPPYWEHPRG